MRGDFDAAARQFVRPIETPLQVDSEHLTDLGNARRLVARHGARFRYVEGRWLHYDGTRWTPDQTGEINRAAKATIEELFVEAQTELDETRKASLRKFALASQSASRIRGAIELAWSEIPMPLASSAFDTDPWLLNVQNGTIDLKSGALRPHTRTDFISKLAPVDYDPDAAAPTWDAFLKRIMPNNEAVRFLRRAVGYSLTGNISEQVFFLLYGIGANGKTTFLSTIEQILGDYATNTPTESLMVRRNDGAIPNDVARLRGARVVTAIEGSAGRKLDEARVKQLTGGDSITARFLHQEYFTFRPVFKLWLGTNHRPEIRGTDLAIWRRVLFVPFAVTIPEPDRDPKMLAKLLAEAPGILAWAVAGCLEWQARRLTVPEVVRDATAEYRANQDTLGGFLEDCAEPDPDARTLFMDIYGRYLAWCEAEGDKHPLSRKALGAALDERGFMRVEKSRPKARRGIRLLQKD